MMRSTGIKMPSIMIQGTGSNVGKSVIATALCRIFAQDGFRVAPFKAQNMSLNSYITDDGKEIALAQAIQAYACMKKPSVFMNPVLLKPKEDCVAEVIVLGKSVGDKSAKAYHYYKKELIKIIKDSYNKLRMENDIIIIEGAGSPAEINLRDRDIVNMKIAEIADSPVILVADIDKGGALAWIVGTLSLLTKKERERIKGIIINKFRGDLELLKPGLEFLEKKTGKPILGVVGFFRDIIIEEEDTISEYHKNIPGDINIGVVSLPHISNFNDFIPFRQEPNTSLHYIKKADFSNLDALIIPGTKNTIADLLYLKKRGLFDKIKKLKIPIIGICGGYQILGKRLIDSKKIESKHGTINGLGLLNIESIFEYHPFHQSQTGGIQKYSKRGEASLFDKKKITRQVQGVVLNSFFEGETVCGYEIHLGRTRLIDEKPFIIAEDTNINTNCLCPPDIATDFECIKIYVSRYRLSTNEFEGGISKDGRVWGTYLHGIFENDKFRRVFINHLRKKKGLSKSKDNINYKLEREKNINKLANLVRKSLDMKQLRGMLNA